MKPSIQNVPKDILLQIFEYAIGNNTRDMVINY